jgi:arylsulfatase A-like enzyme
MKSFSYFSTGTFLIIVLLAGYTGCGDSSKTGQLNSDIPERPNVVFIICDDLNDYSGTFSGHSQVKTPNIDRLAKSGVSFINAHSNAPVCSPSRNSLFTGVYPHKSKDFGWTKHFEQPVLKHNKTLMEYFAENGYHVAGSGKLLHVNRKEYWHEWGVDINNYGPLAFNGKEPVGHPSVPEPFRSIGPIDGSFAPISDVPIFPDSVSGGNRTGWLYTRNTEHFLNYRDENDRDLLPDEMHAKWAAGKIADLEKQDTNQPFFMAIGFVRPHTPLYAPKRFFEMFPVDEIELSEILHNDAEDTHYRDIYPADIKGLRYYRTLKESYGGDAELGLKHFSQAYLACVAFVDEQIGVVIDALNNSKFRDNTIIVLTSDHGWQMGEKDYLFKNSPWEESTRIPLIIRPPGSFAGETVDQPVSLIDLFPTLSDLCGLKGDNRKSESGGQIDGYSLSAFLRDPATSDWDGPDGALSIVGVGLNQEDVMKQTYSYRTRDWRYILYMDGTEELYDHQNDPYEWKNLAGDDNYQGKKQELQQDMFEIINGGD